ncbi:MAG: translation repressor protein [Rickettsiales bacterium]|nr:translation repressor protein [Rickettsiales bacterium]
MEEETIVQGFVEIKLRKSEDFLKIKETLTRIGIPSIKERKLYQSCHILHKRGKYYIVHFKELFKLDGKNTEIEEEDIQRRNLICSLLEEWELVELVDKNKIEDKLHIKKIKIIPFSKKSEWELIAKYNIGKY